MKLSPKDATLLAMVANTPSATDQHVKRAIKILGQDAKQVAEHYLGTKTSKRVSVIRYADRLREWASPDTNTTSVVRSKSNRAVVGRGKVSATKAPASKRKRSK